MRQSLILAIHRMVVSFFHNCRAEIAMDHFRPGMPIPALAPFRKLVCKNCHRQAIYTSKDLITRHLSLSLRERKWLRCGATARPACGIGAPPSCRDMPGSDWLRPLAPRMTRASERGTFQREPRRRANDAVFRRAYCSGAVEFAPRKRSHRTKFHRRSQNSVAPLRQRSPQASRPRKRNTDRSKSYPVRQWAAVHLQGLQGVHTDPGHDDLGLTYIRNGYSIAAW